MSTETQTHDKAERTEQHDLKTRVEELEAENQRLRERLDALEDGQEPEPATGDYRDAAVLEQLDPNEAVTTQRFQTLYKRHSDLVDSRTIAKRIKTLTSGPEFENCGSRVWRFTPQQGGNQ